MKLNNRGFAITTALYGIMVLFLLLTVSSLGMMGTYKARLDKLTEESDCIVTKNEKCVEPPSAPPSSSGNLVTYYRYRDCQTISNWSVSAGPTCYPDEASARAYVCGSGICRDYSWAMANSSNYYYTYSTSQYCAQNYTEGDGMGWTTWANRRSCVSWYDWSDWQKNYVQETWLRDVENKQVYE